MRILVVEDHEDSRTMIERLLTRWGHQVEVAASLEAGREAVTERSFDTIISDIALPDGSGYALMNYARRLGNRALAIAISAYRYPPDIAEPGVTGFDFFLNKPFNAEDLRRLLAESSAETIKAVS